MKSALSVRDSTFPIILMVGFTFLLVIALLVRVYYADRDLAMDRISQMRASLAAESAVHFAMQKMQETVSETFPSPASPNDLLRIFTGKIAINDWMKNGTKGDAWFRITQIKKIPELDRDDTPLFDESGLFQVVSEGKSGRHSFNTTAVLSATRLVRQFAVVNSLNQYYYGQPLQPWIANARGLENFEKSNEALFANGQLNAKGLCYSPGLLYKMFVPDGKDPFQLPSSAAPLPGNYGRSWIRNGDSPAHGPVYCQTPIVVDSHTFWGPVQTALFLYRRLNGLPKIQTQDAVFAVHSSRRVQTAADNSEGENPSDWLVDQDSQPNTSFLQPWRPDFPALRAYARQQGIYVDGNGKGYLRGEPHPVDYHFGAHKEYSETYLTPTSVNLEQDREEENHIVLSTAPKFNELNNLDSGNLNGARILYSENSVYIRGEIGDDLVIVTPRHIFLTGSLNPDSHFNTFLIPGQGVGISTTDLEKVIAERQEGPDFIRAAAYWLVNAVLYKPGGGWYGSWSRPVEPASVLEPAGILTSCPLRIQINGACLEGSLQRWIQHSSKDGIQIQWNKAGVDRLPVLPYSLNLIKSRTTAAD